MVEHDHSSAGKNKCKDPTGDYLAAISMASWLDYFIEAGIVIPRLLYIRH